MKKVHIMRGISGSGKSTWANGLAGLIPAVIVSADHYHTFDGVYRYDPTRGEAAHADCFGRFWMACAQHYETVIVDNTNTTAWEISPYHRAAVFHGYPVEIVEVACDLDVAVKRNVHGVPAESIRRMAERLSVPLPPHLERLVKRVGAL